jgi:hypothetical protein
LVVVDAHEHEVCVNKKIKLKGKRRSPLTEVTNSTITMVGSKRYSTPLPSSPEKETTTDPDYDPAIIECSRSMTKIVENKYCNDYGMYQVNPAEFLSSPRRVGSLVFLPAFLPVKNVFYRFFYRNFFSLFLPANK